jgi:hypothetical protein
MALTKLFILTTTTADGGKDVFYFERRRRMASTKLFILTTTTADGVDKVDLINIFNDEGGWLRQSCLF